MIHKELEGDDSLREVWASVMQLRRGDRKQHKLPPMACMAVEQMTASIGAAVRNCYCLPTKDWKDSYGTLLNMKIMLRRVSTGELCEHVVFHSTKPPNHLIDLQDYVSNQMTTQIYMDHPNQNISEGQSADPTSSTSAPSGRVPIKEEQCDQPGKLIAFSSAPTSSLTPAEEYAMDFLSNPDNIPPYGTQDNPQSPSQCSSGRAGQSMVKTETNAEPPQMPVLVKKEYAER